MLPSGDVSHDAADAIMDPEHWLRAGRIDFVLREVGLSQMLTSTASRRRE